MDRTLSREDARAYYERFAEKQDRQGWYEDAALDRLIDTGGFGNACTVLELGCGTGRFARQLLDRHLPEDARYLGLDSETAFKGRGVSACATCAGFFFRDKPVAVIGGGNTAVEEALYLANIADHVTLVHRRDSLKAEKILQDRLFARVAETLVQLRDALKAEKILQDRLMAKVDEGKVSILWDHAVEDVDGVFVAIGHDPATAVFRGKIAMDAEGYIITAPDSTATDVPGVFAAGDVKDKIYRQAVTAAGMGCMAALEAEKFLAEQETANTQQAAE